MIKKILCLCMTILISLSLSGCWDYYSLNEITIVSGIAVDKSQSSDEYQLSFEIYDLKSSSKDEGVKPKIIDSTGTTLFDAVRNAKKRLSNKLYFGAAQVVIVNQSIAENEGLKPLMDLFLRDAEVRETVDLIISQEKSAKSILQSEYTDNKIISSEIDAIVTEDAKTTLSTVHSSLYQTYNTLNSKGISLTLPAFIKTESDNKTIIQSNGASVFKQDKLLGYLTPEETKYLSFVINKVEGGLLTFENINNDLKKVTLEIESNKTKLSYTYKDNQIKMTVKPKVTVYLGEVSGTIDTDNEKQIKSLEETAGNMLANDISNVIKKVQKQYKTDIFGFGNTIYKKNQKLWKQISDDWDTKFSEIEVEVKPEILIKNTALIR